VSRDTGSARTTTRLKLAAPVGGGKIALVNIPVRRRSLGAPLGALQRFGAVVVDG